MGNPSPPARDRPFSDRDRCPWSVAKSCSREGKFNACDIVLGQRLSPGSQWYRRDHLMQASAPIRLTPQRLACIRVGGQRAGSSVAVFIISRRSTGSPRLIIRCQRKGTASPDAGGKRLEDPGIVATPSLLTRSEYNGEETDGNINQPIATATVLEETQRISRTLNYL